MKSIVLSTGFFLLAFTSVFAQTDKTKKRSEMVDNIKEERIKYIKNKLALTVDEEKKFTPLYTKMCEELESVKSQQTAIESKDLTFASDEECEKALNELIALKEKEANIIKNYVVEFKKVLPVKKVLMIFKAQEEFKKQMVKKIRQEIRKKKEERK